MSKKDDRELQEVVQRLNRLYLERAKIDKKERELRRELEVISTKGSAEQQKKSFVKQAASKAATNASGVKTDRFGNKIEVGDKVEFFTSGRYPGKIWTVYGITEKRVLCEQKKGVYKTHRDLKNVRKIEK